MITNSDVRTTVAANVLQLMIKQKITQAELARRSGESRMQISRLVSGRHNPSAGVIMRVATALGADPAKVLGY